MGAVGHLFINSKLRGNGLAIILMEQLRKNIGMRNEDITGFIHKCNVSSLRTANKIGCTIINDKYQILINIKSKL